jgi:hypothetical protein
MNNNLHHGGRFGNCFFTGMALHFIAKKNNLKSKYKMQHKFENMGIDFFIGEETYDETVSLNDKNFMDFIIGDTIYKNISIKNNVWCQTKYFAWFLRDYFNEPHQKEKIINKNIHKSRYKKNNDVYVHIRLGDIIKHDYHQPFEYYDKILEKLDFENGFFSSDTPDHPICQELSKKYNLKIYQDNDEKTVMFASTCKYLVLSSGTYSWMIGFFGFFSKVYYPKPHIKWHGDIFVFPEWNEIT